MATSSVRRAGSTLRLSNSTAAVSGSSGWAVHGEPLLQHAAVAVGDEPQVALRLLEDDVAVDDGGARGVEAVGERLADEPSDRQRAVEPEHSLGCRIPEDDPEAVRASAILESKHEDADRNGFEELGERGLPERLRQRCHGVGTGP